MKLMPALTFFTLTVTPLAFAQNTPRELIEGRVIRFTKESPVFKDPSSKSKILADVDRGTPVIIRKISPKKTWVLVEDEEKNLGWVPLNRTDYVDLPPPPFKKKAPEKSEDDLTAPMVLEDKKKVEEVKEEPSGNAHLFALRGRESFKDPIGARSFGLVYGFFFPEIVGPRLSGIRAHRLAFETGYLRHIKKNEKTPFSVPARLRILGHDPSSRLATGADFGLLFMRHPQGRDKNLWSITAGYSLAYIPETSGFMPTLRLGVDFLHSTRLSLELSLGYFL